MLNFSKISQLKNNIKTLINNKDFVIDQWMSSEDVAYILTKHGVDLELFAPTYAYPVLNYFIGVVQGDKDIGNCPVISQLLEYLKDKEITSSELFIICINFRKSVISLMFQHQLMNEVMYSNVSYIFDANFRGVLEAFNDTIAQTKAENRILYDLSTKDHLTKIFNRKKFDDIFSEELILANLSNKKLSLILLDIDHFKSINDTYGHDAGDKVLISLACLIQLYIRDSDIFARWGGEEFVILMPKADKTNALKKAELIRNAIQIHTFDEVGHLTCSFGVSNYELGDSDLTMFKRADNALYLSKENGRNRVHSC